VWSFLGTVFSAIGTALISVASSVGAAMIAVWHFIEPIFLDVWGALKPIWSDVLKPFFSTVGNWFTQIKSWWDSWAGPITKLFSTISKVEHAIYDATFGPLLDTISNIQKLLTVTQLSHTAIGGEISGALNTVQTQLQTIYQTVTTPINQIINTVERYMLDVNGLLSAPLLVGSIIKNFDTIWSVWWTKSLPALSAAGQQAFRAVHLHPAFAEHKANLEQLLTLGGGPFSDAATFGQSVFSSVIGTGEPPPNPDEETELY